MNDLSYTAPGGHRPAPWTTERHHCPDYVDRCPLNQRNQPQTLNVPVCSAVTRGHSASVARVLRQPALKVIEVDTSGSTVSGQPAAEQRLMCGW